MLNSRRFSPAFSLKKFICIKKVTQSEGHFCSIELPNTVNAGNPNQTKIYANKNRAAGCLKQSKTFLLSNGVEKYCCVLCWIFETFT